MQLFALSWEGEAYGEQLVIRSEQYHVSRHMLHTLRALESICRENTQHLVISVTS